MTRTAWFMVLLTVFLLLAIAVIGCNTDDEGEDLTGTNGEGSENGEEVALKGFLNPVNLGQLIDSFSELTIYREFSGFEVGNTYIFEEMENLDGVEVSRITFDEYNVWLDADGEIIQARHKTLDHLKGEDGISTVKNLLPNLFFTFQEIAQERIEVAKAEAQGQLVKTETREFGELTATVNVYQHSFEYKGEQVSGEIHVADFGDFKMVVEIDLDNDYYYEITTMALR
ncbi:MAG TPA: hypothetical protein GXZ35_08655 [Acholeplasmataceae bacterium]|jgi:hypothetical protein|nr:hypothetical protein [Acholeplasmataceae bacterium]